MKVFDVLREALDVKQLPDGDWAIVDTDTGRPASQLRFDNAGAAEEARDAMRARTRPNLRAPERGTPPSRDLPSITAGVRPGTPTTDSLSASERRRLARGGSVRRNGITYTRAQIQAADAEAARLRGSGVGSDVRPGDDRVREPASGNRNPRPDAATPDGPIKRFGKKLLAGLRILKGASIVSIIEGAINLSAFEDSLDAYLRAIRTAGENANTEAERTRLVNGMRSGNPPQEIAQAYYQCVQQVTELIVQIPVAVLTGGVAAAYIPQMAAAFASIGIASGGWAILVAIVAGGALALFGNQIIYSALERVGFNDWAERTVAQWLTPAYMVETALGMDDAQELIGSVITSAWAGTLGVVGVPGARAAGDLVRDDINEEADSDQGLEALKDMVRSDPRLMQAYRDGKDRAVAVMRGEAELDSEQR